eukprot:maker-scaffold_9-snap-gene-3.32-mRNA-1 protein AED:0.16 eAED:0.16 QI:0/0/0/1/1/1/3/0/788
MLAKRFAKTLLRRTERWRVKEELFLDIKQRNLGYTSDKNKAAILTTVDSLLTKKKAKPKVQQNPPITGNREFLKFDPGLKLKTRKKSLSKNMDNKLKLDYDASSIISSMYVSVENKSRETKPEKTIIELNEKEENVTEEPDAFANFFQEETISTSEVFSQSKTKKKKKKLRTKQQRQAVDVDKNEFPTIGFSTSDELFPRIPTVTVMGHVDHGKTTLLDHLRSSHVADSEAGGITQKISAFTVDLSKSEDCHSDLQKVVFLDTPGHEAFSSVRADGSKVTDLAIICVAVTEGLKPQTIESLELVKQHKVPILVAVTKVDMVTEAEIDISKENIKNEVLSYVNADQLVDAIPISSKKNIGIQELIESLALQAEVMELKSTRSGRAEAVLLESQKDKGYGSVIDVLLKRGSLEKGDLVIYGESYGKIKTILVNNKPVSKVLPGEPARLVGIDVSTAHATENHVIQVPNLKRAREVTEYRKKLRLEEELIMHQLEDESIDQAENSNSRSMSGEASNSQTNLNFLEEKGLEIPVILKADSEHSLDAIKSCLNALSTQLHQRSKEYAKRFEPVFTEYSANHKDVHLRDKLQKVLLERRKKENHNPIPCLPLGSKIRVISESIGDVTQSDLAQASAAENCRILAFNVEGKLGSELNLGGVGPKIYSDKVIYTLMHELEDGLYELLPSLRVHHSVGQAEVLKIFKRRNHKNSIAGGCRMLSGEIFRIKPSQNLFSRIIRKNEVVKEFFGNDLELRKETTKVEKVASGEEFGISYDDFNDIQVGDIIESMKFEELH